MDWKLLKGECVCVCVHAYEGGRERGRVGTSDEEDGNMQSDNI